MRDTAPAGFVDFVVARGPALHRTAVLLTRDEQAAEDLVQIALAKAWQSWARIDGNYEAYVRRILINEFASAWRRRWRTEVPTADLPELPRGNGDLSTRQVLLAALATLSCATAGGGGAAFLPRLHRGRHGRGDGHKRRHGEIPDLQGSRGAARLRGAA